MAAITWQNINGPSLGDASRSMESAQRSMTAAFGGLGDVLKQEKATQEANWNQGKLNNKEAFLNTLYGAKSPEEMQALQQSGQLNTMLSGYGAQVADPGALRQAMEGRLGTLQQQALVSGEYQDKTLDRKQAPSIDQYKSAILNNDPLTANIIRTGNPDWRNGAALDEFARNVTEQNVQRGRATTTFTNSQTNQKHQEALQPGALLQQTAQTNKLNAEAVEKNGTNVANSLLANSQKQFADRQLAYSDGVSKVATELGIKLNQAGEPVLNGVDLPTLQKYKDKVRESLGDPVSSSVAEAEFSKAMRDKGVTVKDQVNALGLFGKVINDGSVLSDADASALKAGSEKIDARNLTIKKDNPFVKSAPDDVMKHQGEVLGMITNGVKDGEYFTKGPLKNEAMALMTKGMTYKNSEGKQVTTVIQPALMKLALQEGLEGNTFMRNSTMRNAEAYLKKALLDPNNIKLQQEAAQYETDPTGTTAKATLMKQFRDRPGIQGSPQSLLNNLDANIASAQKRAGKLEEEKKTESLVVPATPGSAGQPTAFATPVPAGATVGNSQGVALNLGNGAAAPTKVPEIPKGLPWGETQVVTKATVPGGFKAKVTFVDDGDGIKVTDQNGKQVACRLDQIDAPEVAKPAWTTKGGKKINANPDQTFGPESKQSLETLLLNKEVTVSVTKTKDGRGYCEVELEGKNVSLNQVQEGLAMVYDRFVSSDRRVELKTAESQARAAKKGLWGRPNPQEPEQFRRMHNP